jgi:hypothetical protein
VRSSLKGFDNYLARVAMNKIGNFTFQAHGSITQVHIEMVDFDCTKRDARRLKLKIGTDLRYIKHSQYLTLHHNSC